VLRLNGKQADEDFCEMLVHPAETSAECQTLRGKTGQNFLRWRKRRLGRCLSSGCRRPRQCQCSSRTGVGEVTRIEAAFDCACNSLLQLRPAKRIAGVTHSNPYLTVGPGLHEACRDSGTNGNLAVLYGVPRRRITSFP
jgi:hypothetical protein